MPICQNNPFEKEIVGAEYRDYCKYSTLAKFGFDINKGEYIK